MSIACKSQLAILTGLPSEAAVLRSPLADKPIMIKCAASAPERARFFMARMIADGATACLSFGLAGGLAPHLPAGRIIIASHSASPEGVWEADHAWQTRLQAALPHAQLGGIWGSESIIAAAETKAALYESSQCLVCDMETHIVAKAAQQARLPFAALRVVCDPADFTLPPAALLPLRANGAPDMPAILGALLRQPAQLPALLALATHHRHAMRGLAHAATALSTL